jgi:hypothetical protein
MGRSRLPHCNVAGKRAASPPARWPVAEKPETRARPWTCEAIADKR